MANAISIGRSLVDGSYLLHMVGVVKILMSSVLSICFVGGVFGLTKAAAAEGDPFTPIERQSVTVENHRVTYVESGAGRPIILLHGNAGGVEDFEFGAVEDLAHEYRVIAIDRPGHGDSDRPDNAGSVEYQAEFLHQTLAEMGIYRPILVGHSWGGSLALAYALKYPDDVAGMVLLAPAAYPDGGANFFNRLVAKVPVIGDIGVLMGQSVMGERMLRREIRRAFYPQAVPDSYSKLISASWLGRKQLKAYFEDEVDLNGSLETMGPQYPQIKIPVAIVTGDQDKMVSPKDNAYRLRKAIPGSHLIELKNTGHEIPQTEPKSIASALRLING